MLTIFDCDGVLVDTEVVALETLSRLMSEWGRPMSVAECRDAFMGCHNTDVTRGLEARLGHALPLPGGGVELRAIILENVTRDLVPMPGAADVLSRLDGPRCVASSSDVPRIQRLLALAGLDGFFEHLFSGLDVPRGKPAPDLFLCAAREMGFAPRDCFVVEDSTQGVIAGVAAGMRVIGFTGGAHADADYAARLQAVGATTIARTMAELPGLLARERRQMQPSAA